MASAPAFRRPLLALVAVLALTAAACSASGGGEDASPTTTAPKTTTTSDGGGGGGGGGGGTTSTTEGTDGEPAKAPRVGDCWTPVFGDELDAVSFAGDPADCDEEHGGVTVGVIDLTAAQAKDITPKLLDGDPSDPDVSGPIQSVASEACAPSWTAILEPLALDPGNSIILEATRATKLHRTFWLPTGDQWEAGSRWLRCDLQTSNGTSFTSPLDALQKDEIPADLVPCLAKSIGTGKGTLCTSKAATWQVMATFAIKGAAGPQDTAAYRTLLEKTLPPLCQLLTIQAAGDVGNRVFRIFTQSGYGDSTGDFTCAVRVTGPVTEPFGT
ncbi:hypothetical protein BH10ACT1_BH10ACT1_41170 [soil metagenome]